MNNLIIKDVWINILSYCDHPLLIRSVRVCVLFKNVIQSEFFWQLKCDPYYNNYNDCYYCVRLYTRLKNVFKYGIIHNVDKMIDKIILYNYPSKYICIHTFSCHMLENFIDFYDTDLTFVKSVYVRRCTRNYHFVIDNIDTNSVTIKNFHNKTHYTIYYDDKFYVKDIDFESGYIFIGDANVTLIHDESGNHITSLSKYHNIYDTTFRYCNDYLFSYNSFCGILEIHNLKNNSIFSMPFEERAKFNWIKIHKNYIIFYYKLNNVYYIDIYDINKNKMNNIYHGNINCHLVDKYIIIFESIKNGIDHDTKITIFNIILCKEIYYFTENDICIKSFDMLGDMIAMIDDKNKIIFMK